MLWYNGPHCSSQARQEWKLSATGHLKFNAKLTCVMYEHGGVLPCEMGSDCVCHWVKQPQKCVVFTGRKLSVMTIFFGGDNLLSTSLIGTEAFLFEMERRVPNCHLMKDPSNALNLIQPTLMSNE